MDIIVKQIEYLNKRYKCNIPLVLMNSYFTEKETLEYIKKYSITIETFNQSIFPRIDAETYEPLLKNEYPAGHGHVYIDFYKSELFNKFKQQGKEYIFISNIDNLGATLDLNIFYNIYINKKGFLCRNH